MSYIGFMSTTQDLASLALASINSTQLIDTLEDLGYEDVDILPIRDGFALMIGDAQIALGIGEDALEASEDLLDRAADLFFHSVPEA